MGIKAGSGRGSADVGGSKPEVPGGVGSSRKRGRNKLPPPPPKKPLRPTENPFPEKKDFRLGQYRVVEERDDYLICTGYDPNAEIPAAEVTPSAFRSGVLMKVAKPPALQRTPWEVGPVTIGGVEYTYTYSDVEYGVRTATWTDGGAQSEEQRIDPPYTLDSADVADQIIVAVQIRKNAAVDGMVVSDEAGTRLRWIDLNVSGRHWKSPSQSSATRTDPANFTLAEMTPSDGSDIALMDRGRRRFLVGSTDVRDMSMVYSSDGLSLYVAGNGWINKDNGVLVKWNVDASSANAYTVEWYSTEGAMTSPGEHLSASGSISSGIGNTTAFASPLCEASDGKIWLAGGTTGASGRLAAFNPTTGAQVIDISHNCDAVYRADSSGSVLAIDSSGAGGKYMRIYDSSGNETASWSVSTMKFAEVGGSVIVVANAAGTTLKTLNLSNLTEISSRSNPAGEAYIAGCTDGTTVWVSTSHATTPKYRSYSASDLATENWNVSRDTSNNTSLHMKYANSAVYDFAERVRKINSSSGAETWEASVGSNSVSWNRLRFAVGASIVYTHSSGEYMYAIDDSTGNVAWIESRATNLPQHILPTSDGRLFICGVRTPS